MAHLKTLLLTYILGGLTFIPLLLVAVVALLWYTSPEVVEDTSNAGQTSGKPSLDAATTEVKQRHKTSTRVYRSGWITVRRTFEPVADAGNDAGYMTMMASSYRSFVDSRSKDPRKSRPRDKYYAVLKDTVLFLYEDEQENDCYAAIKLPLHEVVIYPEHLIEGELFMKKNAICLRPILKAGEDVSEEVPSLILRPTPTQAIASSTATATASEPSSDLSHQPWFIFPSINHDKEDWYHSLVTGSKLPLASEQAKDASLFDPNDMGSLVEAIDDQPDPIPTRWLNAMIGRLFFSVYRTSAVEDYIVRKIMRKLSKVNKPDFLGDIEVKEVDVGKTTPFFSKPMLKELTAEGDASMEVHVKYAGEFRIAISTTATLNLGQRFKSYSVKLVLAVILKDLEGNVLFKVKKPPSNRVWFGFTSPPKLGLRIEPVVSTRQIKWSLVTKPIESRLRELVAESIVLPHMDDIAFFDTKPYGQRGGIYGECARRASDLRSEVGDGMEPAIETEDGQIPPGVPNVKLGDPKISSEDNMRQRNGRPRKSSTSDSLLSTKSVPIAALGGKDKPLAFSLASHGTSMSLDHPSHESKHHKHKDHDHSRKKSWFSSSGKASITATRSQSAVPLSSEKASQHEQSSPLPFPSEVGEPASDTTVSAAPVVNPESGEAAVLKLKELLQAGKQRSSSERASSAAENRENSVYPLPEVAALSASPEPSLYRTSSGSSSGTAQAPQKEVVDTTSPSNPPHASSNGKVPGLMRRSSDKSHMSTGPVASENKQLQNPFTDESSISSTSDSASIQTNNSGTSSNIAILQNWKTKATDKQAIQASVNQARDAMSKWGSKWQAYRQAQHAAAEAEKLASIQIRAAHDEHSGQVSQQPSAAVDSVFPSYQDGTAVTPHTSRSSKQDGKLTPETRSRSSSLLSTSPKGQFQPSPATTTTSLSGISGITALNEVDNPSSTQKSPTVRRVPPPSAVPVHPAVGTEADRAPPPKRKSYTPAPRMSIPGIDDSRRFHVSSADVAQPKASPPPLPSRKPVPAEEEAPKQSPKRIPPPTLVEAQGDLPDPTVKLSDQAVVSATSGPPPLPPRHVNDEDGAVAGVQTVPMDGLAHIPTLPATTKLPHDDTALELPEAPAAESFASPEVFVQPPTPSDTVTGQKNESAGV